MKSQVFKSAWKMVKETGVTFSNALTIAWAEAKMAALQAAWYVADGMAGSYQETKRINGLIAELFKRIQSIKVCSIVKVTPDYSGAAFDYGVGKYNGD